MRNNKNFNLKTTISKGLIILSALFLFGFNIKHVSAKNVDRAVQTDLQKEIISDELIDFTVESEKDLETEENIEGEHETEEEFVDSNNSVEETDKEDDNATDIVDEDSEKNEDEDASIESDSNSSLTETDEDSTMLPKKEVDSEKTKEELDEPKPNEEIEDTKDSKEELDESKSNENTEVTKGSEEELPEENDEEIEVETQTENKDQLEDNASLMALQAALYQESSSDIEIDRIDGKNRFSNAVELSKSGWDSSSTVYLVNGHKFADMLSGAPLAALKDAPILFTQEDNLPATTLAEINRLNAKEVIVLGGEPSVHNSVLDALKQEGLAVSRIGGKDRYEQAELVSHEVMEGMSHEGKKREAFLVSGELFSDGMSIAPVAASKKLPIFLTRGNRLDQTIIDNIPFVSKWILIGGYPTISLEVEQQMNDLGAVTQRIDGKNRYEVNRNILDYYGVQGDHVYVTSGNHYSDGIPASILAAKKGNSLLLIKDENKQTIKEQRNYIHDKKGIRKYTFVGSTATLSAKTANDFLKPTYTVYLDPGHGGSDSGAVNNGITKKDLNLSVSLKINDLLKNQGYDVIMSRTTDQYVDLYDRADEANSSSADIFVSVHHNAMPGNNRVTGIESYYYQYHDVDTYKPRNKGSDTYKKATSQERAAESFDLANAIHGDLISSTGVNDRGVREMGFAVIRETTMPAVLLELGFMTNVAELNKLNTNSYQNTLANAVVIGINRYFS